MNNISLIIPIFNEENNILNLYAEIQNIFKDKKKGIYVDIGCCHPIKDNNTYLLNKKGWSGINIDLDLEKSRLQKRINELNMHLVTVNNKLENKDFLKRAPEDVILGEKDKKENMVLELEKITKNFDMIK